ncbi:hypothetical protein [Coraliomargarita parva]|uniref:hypothetical protein n=1 Tax=Coraliomargarita parva TaxID=3014050 RepID=UPI0022B52F01|nr:hypothetical protein [Coraliomargarita parva]
MSSPLTSRTPLKVALAIASLLIGGFSIALLLNEDLRHYTAGQIEEITTPDGEKVKRVKIEKPEPNKDQVLEISRNQERKKREELKETAKALRETVLQIEEVVEAKKQLKDTPETEWEKMVKQAESLQSEAVGFFEELSREEMPDNLHSAQPEAEHIAQLATQYGDLMHHLSQKSVSQEEVDNAVQSARNLMREAKGFGSQFAKVANQAVPEDQKAAEALKDELKGFIVQAETHFKEMARFARTPYATEEQANNPEQDDLAEKNSQKNDQLDQDSVPPSNTQLPSDQELEEANTAELYKQIQEMAKRVDESFTEGQATDLANRKDLSMQQARDEVFQPVTEMGPNLEDALKKNLPSTRKEFQSFNKALNEAASAAQQMARTAKNREEALTGESIQLSGEETDKNKDQLKSQLRQQNKIQAKMTLLAQNSGRESGNVQDMRMLMAENYSIAEVSNQNSSEDLGFGIPISPTYKSAMKQSTLPSQATLDTRRTMAQAIPGRRLDMKSPRQGWIFLDTWYVIGPWERPQEGKPFEVEFPPEAFLDLDATYSGKIPPGRNEPMKLEWRFVQTENIRINPPDEIHEAVYYGFTEVFCETAMEVTIAIASDDMAKLWINGLVVFEDEGLSRWSLDEGFRTILLKPGYNKVLVRVENGPRDCYFSVLMCPTDALQD